MQQRGFVSFPYVVLLTVIWILGWLGYWLLGGFTSNDESLSRQPSMMFVADGVNDDAEAVDISFNWQSGLDTETPYQSVTGSLGTLSNIESASGLSLWRWSVILTVNEGMAFPEKLAFIAQNPGILVEGYKGDALVSEVMPGVHRHAVSFERPVTGSKMLSSLFDILSVHDSLSTTVGYRLGELNLTERPSSQWIIVVTDFRGSTSEPRLYIEAIQPAAEWLEEPSN
jgi:hypothetical protein